MNPQLPNKKQKFENQENESHDDENDSSGDEEEDSDSGGDFDEDEEDNSEVSGEEQEIGADGIVNIDFEGLAPTEVDHESIKRLLDQLFRGILINTSNLTDMIIKYQGSSTVLKDQDGDESSTYAVASAVNLSNPLDDASLETALEFRTNVLAKYEQSQLTLSHQPCEDMKKFQIAEKTDFVFGLVVLEKIVNIPESVAWQMLTTLKEDIEMENGNFTHFFMLTKRYKVGPETFPVEAYFDVLEQFSQLQLDLELPGNTDTIQHNHGAGKPFRRLLLFKAPAFYQAIESHVSGN